jgi:hypothetical protein
VVVTSHLFWAHWMTTGLPDLAFRLVLENYCCELLVSRIYAARIRIRASVSGGYGYDIFRKKPIRGYVLVFLINK